MRGRIRSNKPLLCGGSVLFRNLEFAYAPAGYNWWERFVLNNQHKKALKLIRKKGLAVIAANEKVAFDLHRYYRVAEGAIQLREAQKE